MPTYAITDPETKKTIRITGDSPPTENELHEIFSSVGNAPVEKKRFDPMSAVENFVPNLWEGIVKPTATAIAHPLNTAEAIGKLGAGGIVEGLSALGVHGNPQVEAELKQTFENFGPVKAVTEAWNDPLGVPGRVRDYIAEKPAQALQAASMTAALTKKLASAVGMTKKAETLDKAATALDPLNATLSVAGGVGKAGLKAAGAFFGGLTGKGQYAFEQAGRPGFFKQLWGKSTGEELVTKARQGLSAVLNEGKGEYRAGREAMKAEKGAVNFAPIGASLQDMLESYNVNFKHGGFQRLVSENYPKGASGKALRDNDLDSVFSTSTLTDKASVETALDAIKTVHKWGKSRDMLTLEGLDVLKRKFGNMYSETDAGRALVSSLYNATKETISSQFPKYKVMMEKYSDLMDMEYQMGSALGIKDGARKQVAVNGALNKFMATMREDGEFRKGLLDQISKGPAKDLPAEIAGYSLRGWQPSGLVGKSAEWGALFSSVYHHSPKLLAAIMLASPKITASVLGSIRLAAEKAGIPLKAAAKATTLPRQAAAVAGKETERQQQEEQ